MVAAAFSNINGRDYKTEATIALSVVILVSPWQLRQPFQCFVLSLLDFFLSSCLNEKNDFFSPNFLGFFSGFVCYVAVEISVSVFCDFFFFLMNFKTIKENAAKPVSLFFLSLGWTLITCFEVDLFIGYKNIHVKG